jgi:hypothetical protein
MPIPKNIKREHIFQAMLKIHREGIPVGRHPREWAVQYEGDKFPCKLLISWANIYANGIELDTNPSNFQTNMAIEYLTIIGFDIVAL